MQKEQLPAGESILPEQDQETDWALKKIRQLEKDRQEWIDYCICCDKILSSEEIELVYSAALGHVVAEKCIYCGNPPYSLETLIANDYFVDLEAVLEEVKQK